MNGATTSFIEKFLFSVFMNFTIVVVFQNEPIISGNASIYIFRLTKLNSNVRTLRSSRHSQSQSQDVLVIQPKLAVRHYYKAQKHNNTECNMSSSEANLRTNQSFVCMKTDYCVIVPTSACSQLHPGLWPDSSSFANMYRMSATSANRITQSNRCYVSCIHQTPQKLNQNQHFVLLRYLGVLKYGMKARFKIMYKTAVLNNIYTTFHTACVTVRTIKDATSCAV